MDALSPAMSADLHLKMSKKIAQLTKVIFHLNTRNEDFQIEIARTRATHTDETQRLAIDAATKLKTLQDELNGERVRQQQLQQALKDVDKQRDMEKMRADALLSRVKESEAAFQTAVRDLEGRVVEAQQAFERKLNDAKQEADQDAIDRTTQLIEKHILEIQRARQESELEFESIKKQHELQAQQWKSQTDTDRDKLVSDHNQEVQRLAQQLKHEQHDFQQLQKQLQSSQDLAKEQGTQLKDLELQLKRQLEQLQASQSSALRTEQEKNTKTTSELLSKIESLLSESETLRAAEATLRRNREQLESEKLILEQESRALKLTLANAREEAESVKRDASENNEKLRQLLSLSTEKIDQIARDLAIGKADLQARDRTLEEKDKQLDLLKDEIRRRDSSDSETGMKLQQLVREREHELSTTKAELTRVHQDSASAQVSYEKRIQALEESGKAMSQHAKQRIEELSRQHGSLGTELAKKEQEITNLCEQIKRAQCESTQEIQMLEMELKRLQAINAKLEDELKEANNHLKQLEQQAQEAVERANASAVLNATTQIATLKDEHQKKLLQIERGWDEKQKQLESKHAQVLTAELERAKRDAKIDTDKQLQALKQQLNGAADSAKLAHEKAIQQMRRENEEALRKAEGAVTAGNKQLVEREALAQKQKQEELLELTQRYEKQLADLEQQWRQQLDIKVTQLCSDYEAQLTALREELALTKKTAMIQHQEVTEASRLMRERNALAFEQLRSATVAFALQEKTERLAFCQRSELERLEYEHAHQEALKALQSKLTSESQRVLDRLREEATRERVDLIDKHTKDLEALRSTHESKLRELRTSLELDKNSALLAARAEFARQKTELTAEKDRERTDLEKKLASEHRREIGIMNKKLQDEVTSVTLAQREISRLNNVIEAKSREMADRCAALEAAARDEVDRLKVAAKRDMDKLLEENLRETKLLSDEFEETRRVMTGKCTGLMQSVRAWEDKYARRESREEDVARIAELARAVAERDALVKRTLDEMAYFKREMLNREETYNKTFARAPNVGVLNVLKPHVQLQAQMQMQANGNNVATPPSSKRKVKPGSEGPELTRRHSVATAPLQHQLEADCPH